MPIQDHDKHEFCKFLRKSYDIKIFAAKLSCESLDSCNAVTVQFYGKFVSYIVEVALHLAHMPFLDISNEELPSLRYIHAGSSSLLISNYLNILKFSPLRNN